MARTARMNPAWIRQLNTARVFHAVRTHPGASQRRLAEITGLDKATISAVVASLVEEGLLVRAARSRGRPGRPEVALRLAPSAGLLVGARLEPGSIRLVAATLAGEPVDARQHPAAEDPEGAIDDLARAVRELVRDVETPARPVRAVGVGVPALFDDDGRLVFAPNLGWSDVPVRAPLEARLDLPIHVDNDTKAAGLAETLFGSCRDVRDFVFLAGHSGIGGALYLGGRLYRGHSGFAGEVGHLKVRRDGRRCACGGRGCLEAYLSESALLAAAREAGVAASDLAALAAADEAGDPAARAVLVEAGEVLGDACADLATLLNPERIVLGGTFATVAVRMLPTIRARLRTSGLAPSRARCRVTLSSFGAEAVTMGGVALALEGFLSLPGWLLERS